MGSRKEEVRSATKLDLSEDNPKINHKIQSALGHTTWDNRSFKRQAKQKISVNESLTRLDDTASEEMKTHHTNIIKPDNSLAQKFLSEWETLESVVSNLLKEIQNDKSLSIQHKQDKKLELIRYVCEELSQRSTQGAICRLFGYISTVYESNIKMMNSSDKVNSSPSAYEILAQENLKLTKKLDLSKEQQSESEKQHKKQLEKLKKQHSIIINKMNEKQSKWFEICNTYRFIFRENWANECTKQAERQS